MLLARKVPVDMNNAQYHFININVCSNLKSVSQMTKSKTEDLLWECLLFLIELIQKYEPLW